MPISVIDQRILISLKQGARLTSSDLARQHGLTVRNILRRLRRLEDEGLLNHEVDMNKHAYIWFAK